MNLVEIVTMNQEIDILGKSGFGMKGEGHAAYERIANSPLFQPPYQLLKRLEDIHSMSPHWPTAIGCTRLKSEAAIF